MRNRPRVLILESMYHPAGQELLAGKADLDILENATEDRIIEAVAEADAVFVRYPSKLTAKAIEAGKNVVIISTSGRGTDAIDIGAASAGEIAVVNNPGAGRVPVSEHTLGLMLEFAKQFRRSDAEIRAGGGFGQGPVSTRFHLEERTVGIVGCGQIGSEVARKCSVGFRMKVLAYDPYIGDDDVKAVNGERVSNLEDLLSASDFVSVHAELTEETRGMVDRDFLRAMRRDAYFLNTARGGIVEQGALIEALQENWIAGAALDVFEAEPIPVDSPLVALDNLIMSPHVGGLTIEAREELSISAASQILQVLAGDKPPHLVNPDIWDKVAARL
ncbi:MAG TPA: dehydrogenase [Rhodospirillaceae bacterium]|nr:dehydrogenase [Rhodospirillaceae bacterium]HAT35336.1 dehydrogenase [Rhodospirillaceae bacterium]